MAQLCYYPNLLMHIRETLLKTVVFIVFLFIQSSTFQPLFCGLEIDVSC